jgi:hypothetical protein
MMRCGKSYCCASALRMSRNSVFDDFAAIASSAVQRQSDKALGRLKRGYIPLTQPVEVGFRHVRLAAPHRTMLRPDPD